jgi:hypothetical protein
MARKVRHALCAIVVWVGGGHAAAHAEGHAIAAKAGFLGLGVEYAYSFHERFGVRVGWNGSKLGFDAEESGIRYDFDLVWDSLSVAFDFHPTRGPLRVSGGVLRNDNRLEAVARTSDGYTIGGTTYAPDEIGTLSGRVEFDDTAPFVGVGWDWSRQRQRFGVSFDIGVVKQGAPRVALSADGAIAGDPAFSSDIAAEQAELEQSLDDFDVLPYASFGIVFRF